MPHPPRIAIRPDGPQALAPPEIRVNPISSGVRRAPRHPRSIYDVNVTLVEAILWFFKMAVGAFIAGCLIGGIILIFVLAFGGMGLMVVPG
jgi:hypothetical protein